MLIDTHCHIDLSEFDIDREQVLNKCCTDGIKILVAPGIIRKDWSNLLQIAENYPLIKPAIGLHPLYIEQHCNEDIAKLDEVVSSDESILAIGEIGLDLYGYYPDIEAQQWYFTEQVKIAKKNKLPIIVHARKSHDLILKQIRLLNFECGGTIHAFSGSLQQAHKFIDLGFKLGFGGTITYDRAKKTIDVLRKVPLDSIVLETDAPFIPPFNHQGERNTPVNLRMILKCASRLRNIAEEELEEITYQNSLAVFGIESRINYINY